MNPRASIALRIAPPVVSGVANSRDGLGAPDSGGPTAAVIAATHATITIHLRIACLVDDRLILDGPPSDLTRGSLSSWHAPSTHRMPFCNVLLGRRRRCDSRRTKRSAIVDGLDVAFLEPNPTVMEWGHRTQTG